jgi:hypothetical protein
MVLLLLHANRSTLEHANDLTEPGSGLSNTSDPCLQLNHNVVLGLDSYHSAPR